MKKKFFLVLYLLAYILLTSLSLAVFRLYKPYLYIENNTSYVICNDGSRFETGPNSIFSFDKKLDLFNEKKAKKLCQYKIIRDYGDMYKTSNEINYQFHPVEVEESSWITAILAFYIFFVSGAFVIEIIKRFLRIDLGFDVGKKIVDLFFCLIA
ncbi:hypothetical protein HY357_03685 [Candidatus Roizmanbacteria bacterium]|nr:hypothetical protein [Candidatus Roizmanbacteria bacterium]